MEATLPIIYTYATRQVNRSNRIEPQEQHYTNNSLGISVARVSYDGHMKKHIEYSRVLGSSSINVRGHSIKRCGKSGGGSPPLIKVSNKLSLLYYGMMGLGGGKALVFCDSHAHKVGF